jgi:hypothetical protein
LTEIQAIKFDHGRASRISRAGSSLHPVEVMVVLAGAVPSLHRAEAHELAASLLWVGGKAGDPLNRWLAPRADEETRRWTK